LEKFPLDRRNTILLQHFQQKTSGVIVISKKPHLVSNTSITSLQPFKPSGYKCSLGYNQYQLGTLLRTMTNPLLLSHSLNNEYCPHNAFNLANNIPVLFVILLAFHTAQRSCRLSAKVPGL
jgi:hypothetical protein